MLCANFVVDITLSADDHARLVCWRIFPGKIDLQRTICITLKIKFLRLKSDFSTLKSSEGLAALDLTWCRILGRPKASDMFEFWSCSLLVSC